MNSINDSIESLTSLTTKLQVSNEASENDVVEVTENILAKEVEVLSLDNFSETSMVARVFAKKGCNTSYLKKVFSRMWKFREPWKVRYLDIDSTSTFFGFSFASPSDLKWVMSRMPWCFTGGFLLGSSWPSSGIWKEANLNSLPLLLTISNIPLKLFTENNLRSWVHLVDPNATYRWKGSNLDMMKASTRTRVNLQIDKRPTVGVFVPFEGKNLWLQFKFDRLPIICYKCGTWGHDKQDCCNKTVVIRDPKGELVQLYGPWLHSEYIGTCFTTISGKKERKMENSNPLVHIEEEDKDGSELGYKDKASYRPPENTTSKLLSDQSKNKITFYFGKSLISKNGKNGKSSSIDPLEKEQMSKGSLTNSPVGKDLSLSEDKNKEVEGGDGTTSKRLTISLEEKSNKQNKGDGSQDNFTSTISDIVYPSHNIPSKIKKEISFQPHSLLLNVGQIQTQETPLLSSTNYCHHTSLANNPMHEYENANHPTAQITPNLTKAENSQSTTNRKRIFIRDHIRNSAGKKQKADETKLHDPDHSNEINLIINETAAPNSVEPEAGPAVQACLEK